MEIRKVYVTSKGRFWKKEEAEKRKNRCKTTDPRVQEDLEPVREEWVMLVRYGAESRYGAVGHTEVVTVFKLTEVEVK